MTQKIRICIAGVTGWTGRALYAAAEKSAEFEVVAGVARRAATTESDVVIHADPKDALKIPMDVWIDFTEPDAVRNHVMLALQAGVNVVIGTSGLTADDFVEIDKQAHATGKGVIAAGNFSITAALAKHCSLIAARYLPHREIIDYAHAEKPDVPSGSVRELAEALAGVRANEGIKPLESLVGPRHARGATIAGTQVHSVRLPSYVIAFETLFALPNERLTIRHDAGSGAEPYVAGTLLAVQRVIRTQGLVRGLDTLLFQ